MKNKLLREYVDLLIEKIRSKKGVDSKFGSKFDLKKFKSLDNIHQMKVYAKTFLQKLGEGSSRAAYTLSSKYVLKIAVNEKGISQNQTEIEVYTNPKSQQIVAKIYDSDPNGLWLISDLVRPLTNEDDFEKIAKIGWEDFCDLVYAGVKRRAQLPNRVPSFIKDVISTAVENDLLSGDIGKIDSWGKTPDGRLVIIDYGFTREVFDKHYSTPDEKTPNSGDKTKIDAASREKPVDDSQDDEQPATKRRA